MSTIVQDHKAELSADVLRASGSVRLRVMGASMLPSVWPGDVVTVARRDAATIVPGDLVLHENDGRFFVHRVIEKMNAGADWMGKEDGIHFVTQGDAVPQPDPPFTSAQLLGRVSSIQRNGRTIIPNRRLAPFMRAIGRIFCYSDILSNFALRVHSFRSQRKPNPSAHSLQAAPSSVRMPCEFKYHG
ncbi:MAG: S24/S26 family peptidase [Terriglobales bacterium]